MNNVTVSEPSVLIRISRLFRPEMTADELYEATRGVWKIGGRREAVSFALAVSDGVVREVYTINQWHPAAFTPYKTRSLKEVSIEGRWEFTGAIAPEQVRKKYLNQTVAHYFKRGSANPITYVGA